MSETIRVTDSVKLVKRARSSYWQAAIKDPEGVWRRLSTGTDDEAKAREAALQKHAEYYVKKQHGIPLVRTHKFSSVAERYMKMMEGRVEAGAATDSQAKHPGVIRNWLTPFFGEYDITAINQSVLDDFDTWRTKKNGKPLARGTISKQKDVLNAVFNFAVDKKYCNRSDIPKLTVKGKGRPKKRRGHFTVQEFNELMQYMRVWEKDSDRYVTRYLRGVLRAYVEFLVLTGLRPGKEILTLRWRDFERIERTDKPTVYRVYVRAGKTKDRNADESQSVRAVLISELAYQQLETLQLGDEKVAEHLEDADGFFKDRLVFAMPDGSEIKEGNFPRLFNQLMVESGMKIGADGLERTLYSCRHTYATWALERKDMSYETLRRQLGTSMVMLEQHYDHVLNDTEIDQVVV